MRYWIKERLDTRTPDRLRAIRRLALRLRHHPKQLAGVAFDEALTEFDAYCNARGVIVP